MSATLKKHPWSARSGLLVIGTCLTAYANEPSAGAAKNVLWQGEVSHQDVYIRSGPSMNHYTVCKVQAGDRLDIVGEQGEWYAILPPAGTFSLVSGDYVDTVDEKTGVINGENVRARAGSSLNDQKYTVQALLPKGSKVTLLGRNPDGFLRIVPPPDATLWVNRAYVERIPDGLLKLEAEGRPSAMPEGDATLASHSNEPSTVAKPSTARNGQEVATGSEPSVVPVVKSSTAPKQPVGNQPTARAVTSVRTKDDLPESSPLAMMMPGERRKALESLEAGVQAELAKEVPDRRFEPLIEGYRAVAAQNEDELAKHYAEARISQLTNMAELVATLRRIRQLNEEADVKRRQFTDERTNLDYVTLPPIATGYDAQGELRVSALYPPGTLPRRYRLVDPRTPDGKTLGYVELPPDSTINVKEFVGQYVGVRASEKRLQVGGVDPVPIYIVREFVSLAANAPPASSGQE